MHRARTITFAAACAATFSLILGGCGSDDTTVQPAPTAASSANGGGGETGGTQPAAANPEMVGNDFLKLLDVSMLPQPTPEAESAFGVEAAQQGALWAVGLAQETAYDLTIWNDLLEPGATQRSLNSENFLRFGEYMTPAGQAKWVTAISGETLYDPNNGPGVFIMLPTIGEGYEWREPVMRPNGVPAKGGGVLPADSFDVKEIAIGDPQSSYSNFPTLKVVFDDFHVYEFIKDGTPHAVQVKRPWVMWLAQSDDPEHPWLLEDWQVGPVDSREVPSVESAGEQQEVPPGEVLSPPPGIDPEELGLTDPNQVG